MYAFFPHRKLDVTGETEGVLLQIPSSAEARRLTDVWNKISIQARWLTEHLPQEEDMPPDEKMVSVTTDLVPGIFIGRRTVIPTNALLLESVGNVSMNCIFDRLPQRTRHIHSVDEDFGAMPYRTRLFNRDFTVSMGFPQEGGIIPDPMQILICSYAEILAVLVETEKLPS